MQEITNSTENVHSCYDLLHSWFSPFVLKKGTELGESQAHVGGKYKTTDKIEKGDLKIKISSCTKRQTLIYLFSLYTIYG